jgi:alpha-L-fucosidase
MFEQDLPGQNKSGLSFQQASTAVPLESCITMNGSWGFNIKDSRYKSYPEIVRTLAGAAGRNSNLLLNVGPMPNGEVQPEFIDTLKKVGEWIRRYGHTVYGTRGGPTPPKEWGVTTQSETHVYLHLFGRPPGDAVTIPGYFDSKSVTASDGKAPVVLSSDKNGLRLDLSGHDFTSADLIVTIPRRK